ncbi:hypothetical protein DNH61_02050 [Paenibacillus sambharensis]|uniref:Uncharacterized protein n=1 Tax=Paenibacillus sambharensis TaxID=1803190 RepID=A0A2W1LT31_9BACL|nr:hypothetical protein DNH61_02050 [Paenibacillus sambharensis]
MRHLIFAYRNFLPLTFFRCGSIIDSVPIFFTSYSYIQPAAPAINYRIKAGAAAAVSGLFPLVKEGACT